MASIYFLMPLMVLTPLIPAYILFKTLGSKAQVAGKEFYGFKVQLGGAFAGYFVLLLLSLNMFKPFLAPPPTRLVYRLEGQIVDEQRRGVPLTTENFALMPPPPPMISANKNGNFSVSFIVDPDDGNTLRYPSIEVSYRDYLPTDLFLDPNAQSPRTQKPLELTRDDLHHVIYVQPISLSKADPEKDVHVTTAKHIIGAVPEYEKIGHVAPATPPPGYNSANENVLR